MKIAIIGAGNMGGAIAKGLAKGSIVNASDITVANPGSEKREALKAFDSAINVTSDNREAIKGADLLILAVKPWLMKKVMDELTIRPSQMVASVAAGISFEQLSGSIGTENTLFRLVPNTAISQLESMTLIASRNASAEQEQLMLDLFNEMGCAML
ncbi:MAG: NAD(P)-binding domain-containing protein, partial [Bacteroides sp.]